MPSLTILLIVWGVLTGIFIVLLIVRSMLGMREEDQLFLSGETSPLAKEQREVQSRLRILSPFVSVLGTASGILILFIAGLWVWRGLNGV